jgi:hypothetical protein
MSWLIDRSKTGIRGRKIRRPNNRRTQREETSISICRDSFSAACDSDCRFNFTTSLSRVRAALSSILRAL